jgi:hypothetical protein
MRRLLFVLANGFILFFYSEPLFWSRPRPEDSLLDWFWTWLAYSLLAFVFLTAVRSFRVSSLPALFIAGGLFGWLAEGVVVQTMYDNFPWQLSWTGLAWHALISVMFGWYYLPRAIRQGNTRKTVFFVSLAGLIWGYWAVNWWVEEPAQIATPLEFGLYAFAFVSCLVSAYWLREKLAAHAAMPRWAIGTILALFTLYFAFVTVPAQPLALIIFPLAVLVVLLTLRRHRQDTPESSLLDHPEHGNILQILPVLLMPLFATTVYSLFYLLNWRIQSNWVVALATTPAGAIAFVWSVASIWRKKSPEKIN